MPLDTRLSRRTFVRTLAVGGLAAVALPARSATAAGPNDRLTLGLIGVGTQGRGPLGSFLRMADVQVVAVCDVVAERRDAAQQTAEKQYADQRGKDGFKGVAAYTDFRELLARKDIDAVLIATPDHWHALPS